MEYGFNKIVGKGKRQRGIGIIIGKWNEAINTFASRGNSISILSDG
jgi:hypothetical protein